MIKRYVCLAAIAASALAYGAIPASALDKAKLGLNESSSIGVIDTGQAIVGSFKKGIPDGLNWARGSDEHLFGTRQKREPQTMMGATGPDTTGSNQQAAPSLGAYSPQIANRAPATVRPNPGLDLSGAHKGAIMEAAG